MPLPDDEIREDEDDELDEGRRATFPEESSRDSSERDSDLTRRYFEAYIAAERSLAPQIHPLMSMYDRHCQRRDLSKSELLVAVKREVAETYGGPERHRMIIAMNRFIEASETGAVEVLLRNTVAKTEADAVMDNLEEAAAVHAANDPGRETRDYNVNMPVDNFGMPVVFTGNPMDDAKAAIKKSEKGES